MKIPDQLPELFLSGLTEISVDASSLIYMLKIGVLGYAAAEIQFLANPSIIEEVGWPHLPVRSCGQKQERVENDDTVIDLAASKKIPLLSEDLGILKKAKERGIPFFNTLMILNYLLLKGRVSREDYDLFLDRLKDISHYSSEIFLYGEAVRRLVEEKLS